MALPAFAMLGKLDNNNSYFDRLYELFNYNKTTLGLYDSSAHLYYRDTSYIYPIKQTPNGKKVFWSRGNGWALAASARDSARVAGYRPGSCGICHDLQTDERGAQGRPATGWALEHEPV